MQLSHFKQTNDYIESCASSHLLERKRLCAANVTKLKIKTLLTGKHPSQDSRENCLQKTK
jgi:hypothetical protein